jgi:hypothetical protein
MNYTLSYSTLTAAKAISLSRLAAQAAAKGDKRRSDPFVFQHVSGPCTPRKLVVLTYRSQGPMQQSRSFPQGSPDVLQALTDTVATKAATIVRK